MTTPDRPPRRWLRFSLRTLFVLVTVIACWLGWQVHVVQHRKAMFKQIEAGGGYVIGIDGDFEGYMSDDATEVRSSNPDYRIGSLRRFLGDVPVNLIAFDRHLTEADSRAIEAFPETSIFAIP